MLFNYDSFLLKVKLEKYFMKTNKRLKSISNFKNFGGWKGN